MLRAVYSAAGGTGISACGSPSTIFTQAFDSAGLAYATQYDDVNGNGDFAKSYDDFTFTGGAIVTDVHWTVGFDTTTHSELGITSWLVEFWNDNAGQPGTLAQTATFTPSNANKALLGTFGNWKMYTFSIDLSVWFLADVGVKYWLSVQPRAAFPPQWGWGTAGAGTMYQDFLGSRSTYANNLAFDLTGCIGRPISGALLLEDGSSYLLLEDGSSKILLE